MEWLPGYDRWKTTEPEPPKGEFECHLCGAQIYDGEYYYDLLGMKICSDCIKESRFIA